MNIDKYTENAQGAIIDCQNIAIEEGHQQIEEHGNWKTYQCDA